MSMHHLQQLVDTLIELGEDREELAFWISIYPDLEPAFQQELIQNLQTEMADLKNAA